MTDSMIRTKEIRKSFGTLEVLKGIDLLVERGEVVSIVGPSGAGKVMPSSSRAVFRYSCAWVTSPLAGYRSPSLALRASWKEVAS